jgi:hypothetical protein
LSSAFFARTARSTAQRCEAADACRCFAPKESTGAAAWTRLLSRGADSSQGSA